MRGVLWAWLAVCLVTPVWLAAAELRQPAAAGRDLVTMRERQLAPIRARLAGVHRIGYLTPGADAPADRQILARLYSAQYALAPTVLRRGDRSLEHLLLELERPDDRPPELDLRRWKMLARSPDGRALLLSRRSAREADR